MHSYSLYSSIAVKTLHTGNGTQRFFTHHAKFMKLNNSSWVLQVKSEVRYRAERQLHSCIFETDYQKHHILIHDLSNLLFRHEMDISNPEWKYGIGTTWPISSPLLYLCNYQFVHWENIAGHFLPTVTLMPSALYLLYPVHFQSSRGLFIKIGIVLGNNDVYVGNLCGSFNLLVRLNAHGVLSVIHDSLISAGVITVYEQSVSVKQISRSVNYSPFWDLCKSQWRKSNVCRVCVCVSVSVWYSSSWE